MTSRGPDTEEKVLRFGCGFVAGAAIAFVAGLRIAVADGQTWILLIVAGAFLFGVLAVLFGDRFWHCLGEAIRWWR
jgi:hypothetical protein